MLHRPRHSHLVIPGKTANLMRTARIRPFQKAGGGGGGPPVTAGLIGQYDPSNPASILGGVDDLTGLADVFGSGPTLLINEGASAVLDPDGYVRRTGAVIADEEDPTLTANNFQANAVFPTTAASVFIVTDCVDLAGNSAVGAFSVTGSSSNAMFGGFSGNSVWRFQGLIEFSGQVPTKAVMGAVWNEGNGSPALVFLNGQVKNTVKSSFGDDLTPSTLWYARGRTSDQLSNRHGEALYYDRGLTEAEGTAVMEYLMAKWQIS